MFVAPLKRLLHLVRLSKSTNTLAEKLTISANSTNTRAYNYGGEAGGEIDIAAGSLPFGTPIGSLVVNAVRYTEIILRYRYITDWHDYLTVRVAGLLRQVGVCGY